MHNPEALLQKALAAFNDGRFADAATGFRSVIDSHPDVAELYINLGATLRALGDLHGAETAYRDALARAPQSALAWFNLGNLLRESGRGADALAAFAKADALQPGTPEILNNLGVQLYDMGAVEDSRRHYEAALAGRPDFADALTNLGNALQRMCRMAEAEAALNRALAMAPDNPVFRLNMSAFMAANGRYPEAIDWAERAIAADPAYIEARLKLAGLLIQQGELERGFAAYEARWQKPGWHPFPAKLDMPTWQGENPSGKRLLVWNEQGFGDALLYARFLPDLAARGARVTFLCEAALGRLMRQSLKPGIEVADLATPPPDADLHVSIMSLPHLLGVTLETIAADAPYLIPNAAEVENWRQELTARYPDKPRVGLVWAGNPGQAHDYSRSMSPADMAPLLNVDGIQFFNLLIGPRGDTWRDPKLADVRDHLTDFAASAALMQTLDLVISVDSAPAHLAGALGCPLWVLLAFDPDSRYFTNRPDSPWYPSARLIRQTTPGNWSITIEKTVSELVRFRQINAKS